MLLPKDIIKFTQPIKAGLHIGFEAPFSDYEDIVLESGTVLQVSPYWDFNEDEYRFRCLEEFIFEFIEKYFTKEQNKDEFFRGFNISILKEDFEKRHEQLEKADLTKLDFSKNVDRATFVNQVWMSHENIKALPENLQKEFLLVFKEFEEGLITSNEVFNYHLYLMEQYYKS